MRRERGEIATLAYIASRHPDELRADFRRFYGIPFSDVVGGRVVLAEACSLVGELLHNPDSAVAREANDGAAPWRIGDYLAAHNYQALTGEKHPGLPKESRSRAMSDPRRQAAINRAKARRDERQRQIDAGLIT